MKPKLGLLFLATSFAFASSSVALPIAKNATLSASDLAAVIALEAATLQRLETDGIEKLFVATVPDLDANEIAEIKKADKMCGKLREIEEVKSESRGSRYIKKWYVTVHEGCLLHWSFRYQRERAQWSLENLSFNTDASLI